MIRFFFTRENLPAIKTPEASAFELLCAEEFKGSIIPFSHMYITSDSYLKQIKLALAEQQTSIISVSEQQTEVILNQSNFPPNLTDYDIGSISELKAILGNKPTIDIAIINGIGGDYNDNYIGLAILQRFSKLLAPAKVTFHLLQSLNERYEDIYVKNINQPQCTVNIHNNVLDVETFMAMNAYVNLTGILNFVEFGIMSHNTFFTTAFSLENIVSDQNLQPLLTTNTDLCQTLRDKIDQKFPEKRPLALIHTVSSEQLKTCSKSLTTALIDELIAQGFNVITPNSFSLERENFNDCSSLAESLHHLTHMILASDTIISTGTLSFHISAALGKPTTLLPITKANVRTAKQIPEVLIWLPHENKDLYIDKVKSDEPEDLETANKIWKNIDTKKLALAIHDFQHFFSHNEHRSIMTNARKRVAIVIPYQTNSEEYNQLLSLCLDELIKVTGFDALWLDIIDYSATYQYLSRSINSGISKAIENDCDYIWLLNPQQIPQPDYINHAIKRFDSDSSIAIVAGMQINQENKTRVIWAGSRSAFPKAQYKSGGISNTKINTPTSENWVPFQSVILRTSAVAQLGLLDESMRSRFSDVDYCFRLKKQGWKIAYEPKAVSYKISTHFTEEASAEELKQDFQEFYQKWSRITGCKKADELNLSILKHVDQHHKKSALLR